jgi:two-component sensor histidine kinase
MFGGRLPFDLTSPKTIRSRLIFLVGCLLLPILALLAWLTVQIAFEKREQIEDRRAAIARFISSRADRQLSVYIGLLQGLAGALGPVRGNSGDVDITAVLASEPELIRVWRFGGPESVASAASTVPTDTTKPGPDEQGFESRVLKGETVVTRLKGDRIENASFSVGVPVYTPGEPISGIAAEIRAGHLSGIVFKDSGLSEGWVAAIVDRNSLFVSRSLDAGQRVGQPARPELGEAARSDSPSGTFTNTTYEGVLMINAYHRSALTDWTAVVAVPRSKLYEPLYRNLVLMLIGGTLILAVTAGLASAQARSINRSVRSLARLATGISEDKAQVLKAQTIVELEDVRQVFEHTLHKIKGSEAHVQLLLKELAHRSKNQIAVVQGIARHTARTADTVATFSERFSGRLQGLAASYDLLLERKWTKVALADLVRKHLSVFVQADSARLVIDGPDFDLTPAVAQSIGLAMHELATNALKYGAWSNETGKVLVSWTALEGGQRLKLVWRERGGPPVSMPASKGFGSVVTTTLIERSLGGIVTVVYEKEGLNWSIEWLSGVERDTDDVAA